MVKSILDPDNNFYRHSQAWMGWAYFENYLKAITVEHIYDACPKYSELGSFRIIAYLYGSDGSRRWQR